MAEALDATVALGAGNRRVKRLRQLASSRKARSSERAFVVDGPALTIEALAAAAMPDAVLSVEGIYVGADSGADPDAQSAAVIESAERHEVPVHTVAAGVLESILDPVTPRPVAAVVARRRQDWNDLTGPGPILLLVELRDPGNTGTLLRTAEAAGAAGVVIAGDAVELANPKVVRAAAGAAFRLPIVVERDLSAAVEHASSSIRPLVATVVDTDAMVHDAAPLADAVLALGNEAHGLPPELLAAADVRVTIALAGPTESLNVAAAGAVLCFEALRQRRRAASGQAGGR